MELKILAPTDGVYALPIQINFEELRQELTARLENYKDLVFTDLNISEAKDARAKLNKLKDAIENKRKEVKKACLAPYEAFEKQIKELVSLVDAPILEIDKQVKDYEQRKKADKRAEIEAFYNDNIGDLADLLPLERIWNDKWLNVTVKMPEIREAINASIQRTRSDLQTIADLKSEFELQIKDTYLRTLDLSAALNEKTRLEEQRRKLAEYEAQKAQSVAEANQETAHASKPPQEAAASAEDVVMIDFRIWATPKQLAALKNFLISNNIKYGRVPTDAAKGA
jgi:hypothetical protein